MKKTLSIGLLAMLMSACASAPVSQQTDVALSNTTGNNMTASRTVTFHSSDDFATTKRKIVTALTERGMTVFAEIDHQQAAKEAGLTMQPATVIVFGTPKAGTPLMVQDPSFALQLPLRVLITEVNGQTQVVMNKTESLIAGHQIAYADVANTLAKAEGLIQSVLQ